MIYKFLLFVLLYVWWYKVAKGIANDYFIIFTFCYIVIMLALQIYIWNALLSESEFIWFWDFQDKMHVNLQIPKILIQIFWLLLHNTWTTSNRYALPTRLSECSDFCWHGVKVFRNLKFPRADAQQNSKISNLLVTNIKMPRRKSMAFLFQSWLEKLFSGSFKF